MDHRRQAPGLGRRVISLAVVCIVIGTVPATATLSPKDEPAPALAAGMDSQFDVNCRASHWLSDDPIVHPGMPGMAHEHEFFGNTETDAHSTPASLRGTQTTCDVKADDSAYWVPTLRKYGHRLAPTQLRMYYQRGTTLDDRIRPFPRGLVMIAGNAKATTAQPTTVVAWHCAGQGGNYRKPPSCGTDDLVLTIRFPQCWDGENLDSWNHKAHMAKRQRGDCPSSHPVGVPRLVMNVHWKVKSNAGLSLASGTIYSPHADFMNGWDQAQLEKLVDTMYW